MEVKFRPTTNEEPSMIILGIIIFYVLIVGFVLYLFFLHRISLIPTIISILLFSLIYLPRLLIIKKIIKKDIIKIVETGININNKLTYFEQIQDFKVEEKKPAVVFFMNNSMVVYAEAKFHLKTNHGQLSFTAIGTEKIQLLKEFFNQLLGK